MIALAEKALLRCTQSLAK